VIDALPKNWHEMVIKESEARLKKQRFQDKFTNFPDYPVKIFKGDLENLLDIELKGIWKKGEDVCIAETYGEEHLDQLLLVNGANSLLRFLKGLRRKKASLLRKRGRIKGEVLKVIGTSLMKIGLVLRPITLNLNPLDHLLTKTHNMIHHLRDNMVLIKGHPPLLEYRQYKLDHQHPQLNHPCLLHK